MKTINHITFLLVLIILSVGCSDKLVQFDAPELIPEIKIEGMQNETTLQLGVGEFLELEPKASLEGKDDNFSYAWSLMFNNKIEPLGNEKKLRYKLDTLGQQQFRLDVIHLPTGTRGSAVTAANVSSRMQNGWYVLKEMSDSRSDLDFLQTNKDGLYVARPNVLKTNQGSSLSGKPVGLGFANTYLWNLPDGTRQSSQQALIVHSETDLLTLRLTDSRVMTSSDALFFDNHRPYLPITASISTTQQQYMLTKEGQVVYMQQNAAKYMPPRLGNYQIGPHMTQPRVEMWNDYPMVLAFDELNSSFIYLKRDTLGIGYFPDIYRGGQPRISSNRMNGKVIFLENSGAGIDTQYPGQASAYALFQKHGQNDRVHLYGFALSVLNERLLKGQINPIFYEKVLLKSEYRALTDASFRSMDKSAKIMYFVSGNQVGFYDIEKDIYNPDWFTMSNGSVITYFKCLDVAHPIQPMLSAKHLLIGTSLENSYTLTGYQLQGHAVPSAKLSIAGEGRVKTILITSSNGSTTANSLSQYY